MSSAQVFAPVVCALRAFCLQQGVDPQPILAGHGVTERLLSDPEARVPYAILIELWELLMAAHPERPLGLAYAEMLPEDLGLYTLLGIHSPDLRSALERAIRFEALFDPLLHFELTEEDGFAEWRIEHAVAASLPEVMEMMMVAMYRHTVPRLGDPKTFDVETSLEVSFGHPRRHPLQAYRRHIPARLRFDAPAYAFHFPAAWLDLPHLGATPGVVPVIERALLEHERSVSAGSFTVQVTAEIETHLENAEPDVIAAALAVSRRTLQRRLKEEGMNFRSIVEDVRRRRAEVLLRSSELSIEEIADKLGYSEPSTLHRVFKRWHGVTPQAFRRGHEASD